MVDNQFLVNVRKEFEFLVNDYGFQFCCTGDYCVEYVNLTTKVRVEGINWGLNSRVAFGTLQPKFENLDLFDVIFASHKINIHIKESYNQIEQLSIYSGLIKLYASPVLTGNVDCFDEAKKRVQRRRELFKHKSGI